MNMGIIYGCITKKIDHNSKLDFNLLGRCNWEGTSRMQAIFTSTFQNFGDIGFIWVVFKSYRYVLTAIYPHNENGMCVHTYAWRLEVDIRCRQSFSTLFFETESCWSWSSSIQLDWLISKPQGSSVSVSLAYYDILGIWI